MWKSVSDSNDLSSYGIIYYNHGSIFLTEKL